MVGRLFGIAIAFALLAGCSEGREPCIHTTIRSRLVSGSITYAFGSGTAETHDLSAGDAPLTLPAGSGACAASTPVTDTFPDGYESGGGMIVGCEPTEGSVRIEVGPVQPRLLALGQPNDLSSYGASIKGAGCNSYCAQVVVTANVTAARGGAAAYPAAVTADYMREVSVHIEFNGGFESTTPSGGLCVAPSGSADLVFVETAADAVQDECMYL
jgi:hypothetical protein